jgi:hypothetical protein
MGSQEHISTCKLLIVDRLLGTREDDGQDQLLTAWPSQSDAARNKDFDIVRLARASLAVCSTFAAVRLPYYGSTCLSHESGPRSNQKYARAAECQTAVTPTASGVNWVTLVIAWSCSDVWQLLGLACRTKLAAALSSINTL